jgi:GT2 family glycosyltransferase
MVNHRLRAKLGIGPTSPAKPEPNVKVRNKTGVAQGWGAYTLPADPNLWTPVPKTLALRLAEVPDDYEVWGKNNIVIDDAQRHGWKFTPKSIKFKPIKKWPSVGIVIPVFNSPALLRECLESLKKTEYKGSLAYTLVDNASTDAETLKHIRAAKTSKIRFDSPVGFAKAVNAGMRKTHPDYFVLLNQDCQVIQKDWLTNIVKWMVHRPQCAIVGAKLVYPPDGAGPLRLQHAGIVIPVGHCGDHRYLYEPAGMQAANYYERVQAVTGAVYAIRASVLEDVGYLDETYRFGCEDIEFCLRAAAKCGYETWYVPTSTVIHHDHGVSNTNPKDMIRVREWRNHSGIRFRSEWGAYIDKCAKETVAFVLPDYNPVAGGCRVVAALANMFITAGIKTTVYTMHETPFVDDPDLPRLFDVIPLRALDAADTLIATRFDTVEATLRVRAKKRFYFVQQIETPMAKYCGATEEDVLRSYRRTEYEIITIGEHLAKQLADMGRESTVLDVGLYTRLYPFRPKRRVGTFRVLMYAAGADYKGAADASTIADAIRARFGMKVEVNSFHRDMEPPTWADHHFRPKKASEVAAVYSSQDVYVYASHSDGFAMTPIEAMSCGTPVILTDFPGKDQYARDRENCLVVPFRDVNAIVDAVGGLIAHKSAQKSLRKFGRQTAEKYDWSRVGAQYVRRILEAPV